ncbi:MAG: recombinase RecA, partial [Planctomycetota bacterium]
PFRDSEFDIMFDSGISYEGDLLDLGIGCDVVEKTGAWLNYGDVRLGQGRENAKKYLAENKDLCQEIKSKIIIAKGMA